MAEKVEQVQSKTQKSPDYQYSFKVAPDPGITRERSFVRTSNSQNINKRRSLAFNVSGTQTGQMRGKPAIDIYRPPNVRGEAMNKLNVNAQEFQMSTNARSTQLEETNELRSSGVFPMGGTSTGLMPQQQLQHFMPATGALINRQTGGYSIGNAPLNHSKSAHHRSILVTHSHPITQQVPLLSSPSNGNILHATGTQRVKFAAEPQKSHAYKAGQNMYKYHAPNVDTANSYVGGQANGGNALYMNGNILQRSKSLSSADALTRGMAGLGLGLINESVDIGQFEPDVQLLIDTALEDPNKLNSRCLMELTSHFIKRAVEGRRYALPISRLCLNIIAKEAKETFLEALLNTCRQWYQEREKLLFVIQGMKSPSRARFTAFMAFLSEMFCQLKRRQLQLYTQTEGTTPPFVLLTLLSKCCEDCVRPPVRSLSEIECLFYVLTCIGRDMEIQLPQQLELIMSLVRDAFLNANDSAPAIRRTLLQLIELKASQWQLPGNTVLYYYPTNK